MMTKKTRDLIFELINLLFMLSWFMKPVNKLAEYYIGTISLLAIVVDIIAAVVWLKNRFNKSNG